MRQYVEFCDMLKLRPVTFGAIIRKGLYLFRRRHVIGSLFSSINNPSRIDKLLDNSALFKDSKNADLTNSNLDLIEENILSAKEGRKAIRVLDAVASAGRSQLPDNLSSAGSILEASSIGLLNNLSDGPFDRGYGNNGFGRKAFGGAGFNAYGFGGNPFTSNIFSSFI
jgi:hypothetical protein